MTETDISSEENRTYHYANGDTFTIEAPVKLVVTDTGSHRVVASDRRTYRPTPGWVSISWKPRDGAPAFVA